MEDALTAKERIANAADSDDVHLTALTHSGQIAGVHDDALAGLQVILLAVTVDLDKGKTVAGDLLHNKAFAAKEAGAQGLLKMHGQLQALFHSQETALLHNDAVAGSDLVGDDRAGKGGGKGDHTAAAHGGILIEENGIAGEESAEHLLDTAAAVGLHLHIGTHPAHSAGLGAKGLTCLGIADHYGQMTAFDLVFKHRVFLQKNDS